MLSLTLMVFVFRLKSGTKTCYFKKYRVPLDVTTTSPFANLPLDMGLVVTFSPSRNWLDPRMKPVTALSCSTFQRSIVGMPLGASFFLADAADVGIFVVGTEVPALNMDPSDMVADVSLVVVFAALDARGLGLDIFGCGVFLSLSSPNPKIEDRDIVTRGEACSADFIAFSAAIFFAF
jgi:hypothetical protein